MESSGSPSDVTRDDVRGVFARLDAPSTPVTAAEVAEELECPRDAARDGLDDLAATGEVRTKRVDDASRIWWRSDERGANDAQTDHEEFTAFVNAVKDYAIFMLDSDGVVASWNEGAERIKGYGAEDIVGEHFSTFYTDEDVADDVPERNLEKAMRDGRVEDEGWRVRADGSRFWANVTITAIRSDDGTLRGFTKVTRDMTERREYEQQLRHERDLTEQVLETVPVSIYTIDADGTFLRANKRALQRIDDQGADISAHSVDSWDLYDADGEPIPAEEWPWSRVLETGDPVYNFQCRADAPNVGERWLSINAAPLRDGPSEEDRIVFSVDDITEQKEREAQLRREYDQTEKLLRTAPIAIAVQRADDETVLANRRAREAFGLTERRHAADDRDPDEWDVYDADGAPLAPDELPSARVFETGSAVLEEELVVDPPEGDRKQYRVNAAPLFDDEGAVERVVTAGEDITELKRREEQLERRKTELETELSEILDRISDAFYALDDEWRFTHLNEYAAELMRRPREELLGREVWEVFPDATEPVYREHLRTAMETQEPVSFELYEEAFDAWFEFNCYPSESGLSIYFRDVTERKEYQRRLEASNERLEQFAYAASHDLQEPLRMISSYLQLVESRYADDLDEDGREFISFAVDGADRMREMIEGLLEYSRVETQGDPFEPVELDAVLEDVRTDLQIQIAESDADIAVGDLPTVEGDRGQLRQVFQNLLDNAIEYSDGQPRIEVDAERRGAEWLLTVSDEGIGIDPDDQERIFEVFQRLHTRDEHDGTGIGLALCERIVDRHDGQIRVDSEPGEGTTFSFTLPAVDGR